MRFSRIAIAAGAVLTVAGALSAAVPAAAARAAAATLLDAALALPVLTARG